VLTFLTCYQNNQIERKVKNDKVQGQIILYKMIKLKKKLKKQEKKDF
jgi:hypothetical protein